MFKTPLTKTALFYFWRKLESSKIIKLIEDCCQTRLTRGTIHQLLVNIIQAVVNLAYEIIFKLAATETDALL